VGFDRRSTPRPYDRRMHHSHSVCHATRPLALVALSVTGVLAAACGSSGSTATTTATATGPGVAVQVAVAAGASPSRTDASGIEWLCKPGAAVDPCSADLTTTVLSASGVPTVQRASAPADPPIDCFYVYPTVSLQSGVIATLHVDPAETSVARIQASRFSQVCKVYAPMYRQITVQGLAAGARTAVAAVTAYAGVQSAWKDYLANYNHGRGVIVIGHSQGAGMLIRLLKLHVDTDPTERKLLVSAMLLGGNVTVPTGRIVGGSFRHIPACTASSQVGCVVAYSSFDQPPPPDSLFGRPGLGVSNLSGSTSVVSSQVLCTNPANLAGNAATPLSPYFPTRSQISGLGGLAGLAPPALPTPWVAEPHLYSGQCLSQGGASWLQVSAPIVPGDARQIVNQTLGATWGLHLVDVNIALGDLVAVAGKEATAYTHRG
jgi:hypothetical protein